jgi:hypothetical protein
MAKRRGIGVVISDLRVEMLQMQLSQLQIMLFGSKHECVALISPNQLLLDLGLSPLGAMSTGGLARWTKLMAYAPDGVLLIDHHGIENHIRPVAVGRNIEQP